MELSIIFILLFAALCHASWNGIIKSTPDADKQIVSILVNSAGAVFFASLYFFIPDVYGNVFENTDLVIVAIISALIHSIYWIVLPIMYKHMDISQSYPIARGLPPILLAIVSFYLVDDKLTFLGALGVVIASTGVILNAVPKRGNKFNPTNILPAFAVGLIITTYTVVDGYGMRNAPHPFQFLALYGGFELMLAIIILSYKKTKQPLNIVGNGKLIFVGAILNALAYGLVLWTMATVQLAYVSAIREVSTIFAVLIGVLIFKEKTGIKRFVFAGITVLGCVMIGIWG